MNKMSDEDRQRMLTEARMYYAAAPVVIPLLDRMEKTAYDKLMGKYRDGDNRTESLLGELFVLNNLKREFKIKEEIFSTLEEKS